MKALRKIILGCFLFLALLAAGTSCSDSGGSPSDVDVSDPGMGDELVSSWMCSRRYTESGSTYIDWYYYYLYGDGSFAYRIVAQVDEHIASSAVYAGSWSKYAGANGHSYHFSYALSGSVTADVWADVSESGSTMTVYTTDSRTKLNASGITVSSQFPTDRDIFDRL